MSVIIRMKNLPITAGSSDVRTFFSGLKIPDGAVHIIGGEEGEVFVGFASDEDARIAMTRHGQRIHGAEIRLLLSSKSEQNAIIAARKKGEFGSPKPLQDEFVPSAPPQQQNWVQPPGGNPYAARPGYEASYPPQNSNAQKPRPDYNSQKNYGHRSSAPQQLHVSSTTRDEPEDEYDSYGYKSQYKEPPVNRFAPPPLRAPEPSKASPNALNAPPTHQRPSLNSQLSPNNKYGGYKGGNNNGPERNQGMNGRVQQGGDSWRESNYSQAPKSDFEVNKFNHPNGPALDGPHGRKTLMSNPNGPYQPTPNTAPFSTNTSHNSGAHGRPPFQNGPPARNGPAPFQNGPPQLPSRNGPAPFQNEPPMNRPLMPPPAINRGMNQPPMYHNLPSMAALPSINKPVIPSVAPAAGGEKFYIELTRLPNDLLRPAALEAFINPSTPLTLSSVKTVFGPGGIHIQTIIRLDSIADYAKMMRRNGEQLIKIRQSDKKAFDTADDGAPVPALDRAAVPQSLKDDDGPRRKSRWGDKSPQKENPRRGERDRSRSPIRKRRRSRSPRRREEHTDPTRWCIQVTNVPFRMKDEELFEWFAEKVRPAKLSRTYYSDGNASDRWVAEFSSESLMRRAFSIRSLCQGRTLKMSYIDNEKADEIMKIEDVYGAEKRQLNEEARIAQEQAEKANPPSFFNTPSVVPRAPNSLPPPSNGMNGLPPSVNQPNGPQVPPPMRGGFVPRGNGAFPPRGGMLNGPPPNGRGVGAPMPFYQNAPSNGPKAFNNAPPQPQGRDMYRGGFQGSGGYRGGRGGGGRGGYVGQGGYREDFPPTKNEFRELVQSIGPRGTVLSCTGFPRDITLEEVCDFFGRYDPDRNSIRIRRGEDGVMTGECMLACFNADDALQASLDLDGHSFRNSMISVQVLQ
ncbi:unnamed protein product [Caenorhabditis sp. 36 PRJEB53466]|nr:unnamed protein product [Caenorhabditis sp. 36 PRJEB53466]